MEFHCEQGRGRRSSGDFVSGAGAGIRMRAVEFWWGTEAYILLSS